MEAVSVMLPFSWIGCCRATTATQWNGDGP